jgi:hypothetical protein
MDIGRAHNGTLGIGSMDQVAFCSRESVSGRSLPTRNRKEPVSDTGLRVTNDDIVHCSQDMARTLNKRAYCRRVRQQRHPLAGKRSTNDKRLPDLRQAYRPVW